MKRSVLIPILIITHVAAAFAAVLIYRGMLAEDPEYVAEVKAQTERLKELDRQLAASQAKLQEKAATEAAATQPAKAAPEEAKAQPAEPKGPALAGSETFQIQSQGMSRVSFTSDAPLETIVGTTTAASGEVSVSFEDLSKTTGSVKVDLSTLKTGIDLRDEHLRSEKWLNTAKYPHAEFVLTKLEYEGGPLHLNQKAAAIAKGTISIHGTTKEVAAPVQLSYFKWTPELKAAYVNGNVLRIEGHFEIKLSEFGVDAGSLLGKKVAEDVTINLNLSGIGNQPAAE